MAFIDERDQVVRAFSLSQRPEFSVRVVLDGAGYRFRMAFGVRDRSWYMDAANDDRSETYYGLRLTSGVSIFRAFVGFLPGEMFVSDDSGLGRDPTLRSFVDGTHRMIYRPRSVSLRLSGTEGDLL